MYCAEFAPAVGVGRRGRLREVLRELELVDRLPREIRALPLERRDDIAHGCAAGQLETQNLAAEQADIFLVQHLQPELVQEARELLVRETAAELEHDLVVEEARLVERRHAAWQRAEPEGRDHVGGRARAASRSAALLPAG